MGIHWLKALKNVGLFTSEGQKVSGDSGPCPLYSIVDVLWIGWLLVSWVSFWYLRLCSASILVFATFFSSATLRWMYQSCFGCALSSIAKYGSLSSSLHFRRFFYFSVFCGLNSSLHKPVTLRELGNASLVYEVPWFRKFLKFTWTTLGSIITKYYFGYPILSKYTSRMGFVSDEIFGSWASSKYFLV